MSDIRRWMLCSDVHSISNCFFLHVMARSDENGCLLDVMGRKSWNREEIVQDLCKVEGLHGKPKVVFWQVYYQGGMTGWLLLCAKPTLFEASLKILLTQLG